MVDDGLDGRVDGAAAEARDGAGSTGTTTRTSKKDIRQAAEELASKYLNGDTPALTAQEQDLRRKAEELGMLEREVEAEASKDIKERFSYLKDVDFHRYVGFPYNALLLVAKYSGSERVYDGAQKFVEQQIAQRIPDIMAAEMKKVEDYFRKEGKRLDQAAKQMRARRVKDLQGVVVGHQFSETAYAQIQKINKELETLDADLNTAVGTDREELVNAIEMRKIAKMDEKDRLMDEYEGVTGRTKNGYGRIAAEDQLMDRLRIKANKYNRYASQIAQQRENLVMYRDLQDVDVGQPMKTPSEMEEVFKDVRHVVKYYQAKLDKSTTDAMKLPAALEAELQNPNPSCRQYSDKRWAEIEKTRASLQGLRDAYLLKKAVNQ